MNPFKKTLAITFAVLFVVTAIAAILLFNFDRRAFTAETYQRAFAREDFYNKIPALMAQALVSPDADTSQLPPVMQGMSAEAWENFIRALLPPDTLKAMGDGVLNSTFAYINMQTDQVTVDLRAVKTSMAGETGAQAVLSLISAMPDCTAEQIARASINLFTGGQIEFCNPPAELLPLITPVIRAQLQFAAAIIPDEMTLITAPLQNDPRQRLQATRFMMRLSPILPIFFLLALTLLAVRTLNDWLKWWGIPTLVAGLLTFIMGLLGAPVIGSVITSILSNRMPTYLPEFLSSFTGDFASAMVRALLVPVIWQGLVLLLIGGAMTGFYYLSRKSA
ncbi:MAG: hypothetical protein IPG44_12235 [Anaerolineales bacterium]|jgi:hypothetical protein|nr:hypothetical protein [Anaerolineales bacterium]MCC6985295.1 hypothetical protein [Anaerolineales bacterium]